MFVCTDTSDDGYLDTFELEALFIHEVTDNKVRCWMCLEWMFAVW